MPASLPELLEVQVPVGGRAVVLSDLLLRSTADDVTRASVAEVAHALSAWDGPGAVVFAGNLFDLLTPPAGEPGRQVAAALDAHPELTAAVAAFAARPERRVVVLTGARDSALAWDEAAGAAVRTRLGAELAEAADLKVETGGGVRLVRVESGQRFDARFAGRNLRDPADTPLGHHLIAEILPGVASRPWAAGIDRLDDPARLSRFVVSRLAYRGLARHAWWLLVPFVVALAVKYPVTYALVRHPARFWGTGGWSGRLLLLGLTSLIDLILVAGAFALVSRRVFAAIAGVTAGQEGPTPNEQPARAEARALVTGGYHGLIAGHGLSPALAPVGRGFYAATGALGEVVTEQRSWLGLPPAFVSRRLASWVELEAGAELHVRLLRAVADLPGSPLFERLVTVPRSRRQARPVVVAHLPGGEAWPPVVDAARRQKRVRRLGAAGIAAGALTDLVSAVTPPLRGRLHALRAVVPLSVSQAADALVALAGVALVFLARGVRRGQRQSWAIAIALLTGAAVAHLVKGVDLEEALICLAIAAYLLANRRSFRGGVDRPSLRWGIGVLAGGALASFVISVAAVEISLAVDSDSHPLLPITTAAEAVGGRFVGLHLVALPHRLDQFLTPALVAVTIGLVAGGLWLASRPVVHRLAPGHGSVEQARAVVARYGLGTLDYFALRSDKQFFFYGDTLVAYGVYGGVCLVSPDPIGPPAEAEAAWEAFRRFVDGQGWTLAVLGASEDWLPTYRASGMHDMYVGDEAVVEVSRMNLEGGKHKSLRQAVNRVAKYGYTISFHDPATVDEELKASLTTLMSRSRRGDVERGFSMTLGRIFDPADKDLLLAVVADKDGCPVAFCQYVPAPGIHGYSLDLMRRDPGEHPNGLIDFLVVETARHLHAQGYRGLGLNFATMRAVLSGESGDNLAQRAERWLLKRMSGSMQIESLWRFNAKFDPEWQARYVAYDSPEHLVPTALAMARAESIWELPVIGRFLVPDQRGAGTPSGGGDEAPHQHAS